MSILGTQLKINIHVEPIHNIHMSDCDFTCTFYTKPQNTLVLKKEDLIKVDDDNYIALVDSLLLGVGTIYLCLDINIPDSDLPTGYRKEVDIVCTGIVIKNKIV